MIKKIKKILIIANSLKVGGGAERAVSLLCTNLSKKYETHLIVFHHFDKINLFKGKYYNIQKQIDFIPRCLRFSIFKNLNISLKLYRSINSISPDIIITATDYINVFLSLIKLLYLIKVPLVISIWSNPKEEFKHFPLLKFAIKLTYRLKSINKIVTVSKGVKKILINHFGINRRKIKTINTGVDVNAINLLKSKEISDFIHIFNNPNIIKFITIGRISEEKGYNYLINAFFKVKNDVPHSKLIIRGNGPLKEKLINLITENEFENDILFLDFKRNLFKYINRSDIFVLASIREAFPTVLLEALACGCPIISSDCDVGPSEILNKGKFGLLVKSKDINDLAEKMIKLAKDKDLRDKFSKLSIKRSLFFTLDKFISEWERIIDKLT